jgi:hypothetical protein
MYEGIVTNLPLVPVLTYFSTQIAAKFAMYRDKSFAYASNAEERLRQIKTIAERFRKPEAEVGTAEAASPASGSDQADTDTDSSRVLSKSTPGKPVLSSSLLRKSAGSAPRTDQGL